MSKLIKILSQQQYEDETLVSKLKKDYEADTSEKTAQEFENACEQFRAVCREIESAAGIQNFKGGFDEMAVFQNTAAATTQTGLILAIKWAAADKLCTYLAGKMKIGQPAWWKQCWGISE